MAGSSHARFSISQWFDPDVIDGAPAARFARRLVELIESGYGLDAAQTQIAMDTEPAAEQTEHVPA